MLFYCFLQLHWQNLFRKNSVESPFAAIPLRTIATKRSKYEVNAMAIICEVFSAADRTFRRVKPLGSDGCGLLSSEVDGRQKIRGGCLVLFIKD